MAIESKKILSPKISGWQVMTRSCTCLLLPGQTQLADVNYGDISVCAFSQDEANDVHIQNI